MLQEWRAMPNRTIYVSEADLPTFEEAQRLAGDNLSATIAQALRRFVEARRAQDEGFKPIAVKVGKVAYIPKRFTGRPLAIGQVGEAATGQETRYEVFQTARGRFALHRQIRQSWVERTEYTLDDFDTLEELRPQVPEELYRAVALSLSEDPVETLDI
jgi:EXLDI family protein